MAITYSVSNTVNYDLVGIGVEDTTIVFPAIYGLSGFGYTVTFVDSTYEITDVQVISSPIFVDTSTVSINSVRIEKNSSSIFGDETYAFAFFDESFNKTVSILDANETESANTSSSVFEWNTPTTRTVNGSYTFEITYINTSLMPPSNEVITKTYTQDYLWSATAGTQILVDLASRSNY